MTGLSMVFKRGAVPWNKGISPSEKSKKRQSELMKEHYKTHSSPMKGKKHSKEAIERNKLAHIGKPAWNKGKLFSEEIRAKMKQGYQYHINTGNFKKGQIPWIKGKHFSEETMAKIKANRNTPEYRGWARGRMIEQLASGNFPSVENTKPERQIKEELIKRGHREGIDFIHQYKFMNKFMCDFCFSQQKVIVEAYGDYWHCNPMIYPYPKNQQQIKGINKDKSKEAYITTADNRAWTYIVLWESDIKQDVAKCVDIIEEVLKGKLK